MSQTREFPSSPLNSCELNKDVDANSRFSELTLPE